jgi:Mlc titration factor MtfA (ptsG expression regulator)
MTLAAFGMTEEAALPLAFVFALAMVLLIRSREVVGWAAVLIFLCGFFVSQTAAFDVIYQLVDWVISRLLG